MTTCVYLCGLHRHFTSRLVRQICYGKTLSTVGSLGYSCSQKANYKRPLCHLITLAPVRGLRLHYTCGPFLANEINSWSGQPSLPHFLDSYMSEFKAVSDTSAENSTIFGNDMTFKDDRIVQCLCVSKTDPYHNSCDLVLCLRVSKMDP